MKRECQRNCYECANCICKRYIDEARGTYIVISSTGCSVGSHNYTYGGVLCGDWTPWGALQSMYDREYYKEEMKKEKERFEEERRRQQQELDDLKRQQSFQSSASSYDFSSYESSYDDYDDFNAYSDYDDADDDLNASLESLEMQMKSGLFDFDNASEEILKKIPEMRDLDWGESEVNVEELDYLFKSINAFYECFNKAEQIDNEDAEEFKNRVLSYKPRFEKRVKELYSMLENEIEWHYENNHLNAAYAFSSSLKIANYKKANELFKKCKEAYLKHEIEYATNLMNEGEYEKAITWLRFFKDEKEAKTIINECKKHIKVIEPHEDISDEMSEDGISESDNSINNNQENALEEKIYKDVNSIIEDYKNENSLIRKKQLYNSIIDKLKIIEHYKDSRSLKIYIESDYDFFVFNKKRLIKKIIGIALAVIVAIVIIISVVSNLSKSSNNSNYSNNSSYQQGSGNNYQTNSNNKQSALNNLIGYSYYYDSDETDFKVLFNGSGSATLFTIKSGEEKSVNIKCEVLQDGQYIKVRLYGFPSNYSVQEMTFYYYYRSDNYVYLTGLPNTLNAGYLTRANSVNGLDQKWQNKITK